LLFALQTHVGEKAMNAYLRHHVETFKYNVCDSEGMKRTFLAFMEKECPSHITALQAFDWNTWFTGTGLPPSNQFDTTLVDAAVALAERWVTGTPAAKKAKLDGGSGSPIDVAAWSCAQQLVFLDRLAQLQAEGKGKPEAERVDFASLVAAIDDSHDAFFSTSQNSEIRFRYYTLGIRAGITAVHAPAVAFLGEQGRMKFVRPLYRDLFAAPESKALALSTFKKLRDTYHSICSKMVAKDLGL
jgi:leukotriene-A4 hydrolase